jgi:hypothetical protein
LFRGRTPVRFVSYEISLKYSKKISSFNRYIEGKSQFLISFELVPEGYIIATILTLQAFNLYQEHENATVYQIKWLPFGSKVKELEEYPETAGVTEGEKRGYARKKWRSFGAVCKEHNVVNDIRGSPQSREGYSIIREIRDELQKTPEKRWKYL